MKVYIAAPFFDARQLEIVLKLEEALVSARIDFYSPRSYGKPLKDMTPDETEIHRGKIFRSNIEALDQCDVMVACVEKKDTGTSFELGYYFAKGKRIILFSEDIGRVNVMLAEAAFAVCDRYEYISNSIHGQYDCGIDNLT